MLAVTVDAASARVPRSYATGAATVASGHTRAPLVVKALGSDMTWWYISASTPGRGPSHVPSVAAASAIVQTSPNTAVRTLGKSHMAASCVASDSRACPTSTCTCAITQAISHTRALSVARPSASPPSLHFTERHTWASGQRNVLSVANALATADHCHSISGPIHVPVLLSMRLQEAQTWSLWGQLDRKSQGSYVPDEGDLLGGFLKGPGLAPLQCQGTKEDSQVWPFALLLVPFVYQDCLTSAPTSPEALSPSSVLESPNLSRYGGGHQDSPPAVCKGSQSCVLLLACVLVFFLFSLLCAVFSPLLTPVCISSASFPNTFAAVPL